MSSSDEFNNMPHIHKQACSPFVPPTNIQTLLLLLFQKQKVHHFHFDQFFPALINFYKPQLSSSDVSGPLFLSTTGKTAEPHLCAKFLGPCHFFSLQSMNLLRIEYDFLLINFLIFSDLRKKTHLMKASL